MLWNGTSLNSMLYWMESQWIKCNWIAFHWRIELNSAQFNAVKRKTTECNVIEWDSSKFNIPMNSMLWNWIPLKSMLYWMKFNWIYFNWMESHWIMVLNLTISKGNPLRLMFLNGVPLNSMLLTGITQNSMLYWLHPH